MGTFDAVFDAQNIPPQQSQGKHPVGNKFPFTITDTDVKDNKDASTGKHFSVTFTSPAGSITNNYNLWHGNPQTVSIAAGQLSALCHATGIFQINMRDGGKALRGGKGLMDIGHQAGQEPSTEKPEGGYVEVKKIYDVNGNEPGKAPAPANNAGGGNWGNSGQQQPQQNQPQTNNAQPQQNNQPQVNQGWSQPQQNQQPQQQNNAGGAQPGWNQGSTAEKPPWQT